MEEIKPKILKILDNLNKNYSKLTKYQTEINTTARLKRADIKK